MSIEIRLARANDASAIAVMSRDLIEHGLGWSWTTGRVRRSIGDRATNTIIAVDARGAVHGFAIMKYLEEEAYLLLLAVAPRRRRHGIGRALVVWLEETALVAGIGTLHLEVRASNAAGREFYRRLGFEERETLRGYYSGREAAVRMRRTLRRTCDTRPH